MEAAENKDVKLEDLEGNPRPFEKPSPENKDIQTPLDAKIKEKAAQKKRNQFRLIIYIVIGTAIFLIVSFIGISLYRKFGIKNEPVVQPVKEDTTPAIQEKPVDVENTKRYDSDNLRVSLEFPSEAQTVDTPETAEKPKQLDIIYVLDVEDVSNITASNLTEGYIVSISTFKTNYRDLDEIAKTKAESFRKICPETATLSKIEEVTLDGIEARTFEVFDCDVDFKITYAPKFNEYYEVAQIYKGDLGVIQKYKATTEEIVRTLDFYPEDVGPKGNTTGYYNEKTGIKFNHPYWTEDCCEIGAPPLERPKSIVKMGNPDTGDAIALYGESSSASRDFWAFVEDQKKLLIDDFVVVKGYSPAPKQIQMKLNDQDAVYLRGFSWEDYDFVYINKTGVSSSDRMIFVFVIKSVSGDDFTTQISDMLDTVEFVEQ